MTHRHLCRRFSDKARHGGAQLKEALMRRTQRWNAGNPEALLGAWTPPPEFVVHRRRFYSAAHAWRTTHRFGLDPIPCRFGSAGDRQAYYLSCLFARAFAVRFWPIFMAADQERARDCVLRQLRRSRLSGRPSCRLHRRSRVCVQRSTRQPHATVRSAIAGVLC